MDKSTRGFAFIRGQSTNRWRLINDEQLPVPVSRFVDRVFTGSVIFERKRATGSHRKSSVIRTADKYLPYGSMIDHRWIGDNRL